MDAIKNFWQWFEANNKAYLFLAEVDEDKKEEMLDAVLTHLQACSDKLFFQIGGFEDGDQELVITAEGDISSFPLVESIIAAAPVIPGWQFVSFIQPSEEDFAMDYDGVQLSSEDLLFLPLEHEEIDNNIGIYVCVPNYDVLKKHEWLEQAVYQIIDKIVGEKSFALDIDYIGIGEKTDDAEDDEYMELYELPDYIAEHKEKFPRTPKTA